MKAGRSYEGFTLVELAITIVIAGILAAVAIPRFTTQGYETTRASSELIQGIRYAQFQSLYHSDAPDYRVSITSTASSFSFTVADSGGNALPDPANPSTSYTRTFPGTTISSAGTITFDGRGEPTCTGFACSAGDLILNVSGDIITMERFTGFVH